MNSLVVCILVIINLMKEQLCKPNLNVTLKADSWEVIFRTEVTLYCDYDLEGYKLRSVKWYRGTAEFFRYDPTQTPYLKTFPIGNTKIDLTRSNETQVTLQEVGYEFYGLVKCEVTVDDVYIVKTDSRNLSVVWLPNRDPVIIANKGKYVVNDTLLANCTSSLSHPAASLSFLLNNEPVGTPSWERIACNKTKNGFPTVFCENNDNTTEWTWLPLNITLEPKHFDRQILNLQCTALVNTYRRSANISIPSKISEPKPERVTSQNSSSRNDCDISYYLIMLAMSWISSR